MLKFFEQNNSCHIIIESPINNEDFKALKNLFFKEYIFWHLEFGSVYSIDSDIVNLLYQEIIQKKKNVNITTHKFKLSRYLHQLGFQAFFDSLLKNKIIHLDSVECILIGGSADSSPKVLEILKNITLNNLTLIVVQHVEAEGKQQFDTILNRTTKYTVSYAKQNEKLRKSKVYLAPQNKHLKIDNGCFILSDDEKYNYAKPSISVSYDSFSSYYKDKLLIIQECGYASDGVDKLNLLRNNDTKIIIQDKDECEAKSMITNALNTGIYDYVLNQTNIINYINFLDMKLNYNDWIKYLLEMIFEIYGYDFRLYQRAMVKRRIDIFMLKHGITSVKDTVGIILFNKVAFKSFFLEVSINVTELFRKPKSFEKIIEFLKRFHKNSHNIKIWSAGCSSGEEVYSVAILLQYLGFLDKSIIYATDFNNVILEEAKNGIYSIDSYLVAQKNFSEIEIDDNLDNYIMKNVKCPRIDQNKRFLKILRNSIMLQDDGGG